MSMQTMSQPCPTEIHTQEVADSVHARDGVEIKKQRASRGRQMRGGRRGTKAFHLNFKAESVCA